MYMSGGDPYAQWAGYKNRQGIKKYVGVLFLGG
jgi:hypothetical protein